MRGSEDLLSVRLDQDSAVQTAGVGPVSPANPTHSKRQGPVPLDLGLRQTA